MARRKKNVQEAVEATQESKNEEKIEESIPSRPVETLEEILSGHDTEKKIAIFMHKVPDPDSMAAAWGFSWILQKKYGYVSQIFYDGEVSHPQNRTFHNLLGVPLVDVSEYKEEEFDLRIIVDATTKNSQIKNPTVIIDHHRVDHDSEVEFFYVEPVGAASTLIWEFAREMGITPEDEWDESVATALFFGIRVDTQELTTENTTDRDFKATQELVHHINRKKLSEIINYPLPKYYFELEQILGHEGNSSIQGSVFVGTVGVISAARRDSLPMLADKIVRMDGIETVVMFAAIGENLEASIRSLNSAFDVNAFCHKVFGRDYSGGKLGMGGATVPMGLGSVTGVPEDLQEKIWQSIKEKVFYKVLHVASEN